MTITVTRQLSWAALRGFVPKIFPRVWRAARGRQPGNLMTDLLPSTQREVCARSRSGNATGLNCASSIK
jgi:hypothetical protein